MMNVYLILAPAGGHGVELSSHLEGGPELAAAFRPLDVERFVLLLGERGAVEGPARAQLAGLLELVVEPVDDGPLDFEFRIVGALRRPGLQRPAAHLQVVDELLDDGPLDGPRHGKVRLRQTRAR